MSSELPPRKRPRVERPGSPPPGAGRKVLASAGITSTIPSKPAPRPTTSTRHPGSLSTAPLRDPRAVKGLSVSRPASQKKDTPGQASSNLSKPVSRPTSSIRPTGSLSIDHQRDPRAVKSVGLPTPGSQKRDLAATASSNLSKPVSRPTSSIRSAGSVSKLADRTPPAAGKGRSLAAVTKSESRTSNGMRASPNNRNGLHVEQVQEHEMSETEEEAAELLALEEAGDEAGQRQLMKLLGEGIFEQWYPDIWEDCLSFLLVFGPAKPPSRSMQVPFLLTPIYDYQLYASWWIWRNMAKCSLSSLLADEMGLGKTFTVWASLALNGVVYGSQRRHSDCTQDQCNATAARRLFAACPAATSAVPALGWVCSDLPTLVIVPPAAIETWSREFALRVPRNLLELHVLHDRPKRPNDIRNMQGSHKGHVICLTTYQSLATRIFESKRTPSMEFGLVVCDEIHDYRSLDSQFAGHLKQFHLKGAKFLFVTGTPIPKGVSSVSLMYHNLIPHTDHDKLDSFDHIMSLFNRAERTLDSRNPFSTKNERLRAQTLAPQLARAVSALLLPHTIRRIRASQFNGCPTLELPEMRHTDVQLPFATVAWRNRYHDSYYEAMVFRVRVAQSARRRHVPGPLDYLSQLHVERVAASIPGLLKHRSLLSNAPVTKLLEHFQNKERLMELEQSSTKMQWLRKYCADIGLPKRSDPPTSIAGMGPKLPVFVFSPVEAVVVAEYLRYLGYSVALLHREMKPSDRDNTVNRIFRAPASHNKSCPILVTTVGLGGKIYTMTEAESCVIFSPQYVEATETQAKHRILRIGQQKETRSYRLVALHSIEPLIVERQHFRSAFDDAVFGQYRTGKAILTAEEMFRAMLRASSSKHGISAG